MNIPVREKRIIAVLLSAIIISGVSYSLIMMKEQGGKTVGTAGTTERTGTAETAGSTGNEYSSIFEKDKVIDIKIDMDEKDLESIMADPLSEEYKSANVTIDGTTVTNAGFRTKGNMTLRSVANSSSDRFSFRIKMDEFVDDQTLSGLDELVINNMYSDPSYLREYLSYEALEAVGAKVPQRVFANIYINGELYGFYLCVEAVDDSFLMRSFGNNDGNLYKQEQGSTLQYVKNSNYDSSEQKNGKDESKADLKKLISILNDMPDGEKGDIESVLDVDSALMYIAGNTVLGNYDSYNGNMAQNYYLYGQNGRFTVIPWDYNMSIGGFNGSGTTTISIDEPVSGVKLENLPLIKNLLEVDEYKAKYHEYIQKYLNYLENFEQRVKTVSDIIRPYVEADPSKFYTMEQFESNISYSAGASTSEGTSNTQGGKAGNVERQGGVDGQGYVMPEGGTPGYGRPGNKTAGNNDMPAGGPPVGYGRPGAGLPGGMQGGMPGGSQDGMQSGMPGGSQDGRQGGMPGGMQDGMGGPGGGNGGGGGMSSGSSISILDYIRDRVAEVEKQLGNE